MTTLLWRRHAREAGRLYCMAARYDTEATASWESTAWGAWAYAEAAAFHATRCREAARKADRMAREQYAALMAHAPSTTTSPAAPGKEE